MWRLVDGVAGVGGGVGLASKCTQMFNTAVKTN